MRGTLTTLAELTGIALVVAGVGFYTIPGALIVAGAAVLLICWRVS